MTSSRTELPYHRLAHSSPRTAQWWRPVASAGVGIAVYAGVLALIAILAIAWSLIPGSPAPSEALEDPLNPIDWAITLGLIAALIPAVVLGVRWGGGRRGTIHSVAGRFRWGLLLRGAAIVVPVYAVVLVGQSLLLPPEDLTIPPIDTRFFAVIALILGLGPLQCAAEEYLFRGLPQQALGTWLRSPLWGILLPIPLFIVGHGYDWAGQVAIGAFALATGFLVWKTGGLELAILIHTANNVILFLFAPFSPTSLQQGAVNPILLLIDLPLVFGVTLALSVWVSRAHGLRFWEPVRSVRRGPGDARVPDGPGPSGLAAQPLMSSPRFPTISS